MGPLLYPPCRHHHCPNNHHTSITFPPLFSVFADTWQIINYHIPDFSKKLGASRKWHSVMITRCEMAFSKTLSGHQLWDHSLLLSGDSFIQYLKRKKETTHLGHIRTWCSYKQQQELYLMFRLTTTWQPQGQRGWCWGRVATNRKPVRCKVGC